MRTPQKPLLRGSEIDLFIVDYHSPFIRYHTPVLEALRKSEKVFCEVAGQQKGSAPSVVINMSHKPTMHKGASTIRTEGGLSGPATSA